jgi:hypothetical protein
MTNTNLRPDAGGNPARSNSTDLKNDPTVMQDRNEFPDAPTPDPDTTPSDQPDLDDFAARLGTDTIETGEGLGAIPDRSNPDSSTDARRIFAVVGLVAGLMGLVVWRRRRRNTLTRVIETINVFD